MMNTQGKPRLSKFYDFQDSRLFYKHYATLTLYFVFVYDNAENALSRGKTYIPLAAFLSLLQVYNI
ncbi:hypothetical protein BVRB_5g106430 isoform B [Beta vulgaris subsp. vulgaris]|nr:hypothetical protein BVRB_5g106430 isoform B [Beta vulgaris subsp. vulgaris]